MIGILKKRAALIACAAAMTFSVFSCGAEQSSSKRNRTVNTTTEDTSQQPETKAARRSRPFIATNQEYSTSPFSDRLKWVYYGEGEGQNDVKEADVFLIAPTVDDKDETIMDTNDEENRVKFRGAIDERKGIFEGRTRIFAPYYSQLSTKGYEIIGKDKELLMQFAYSDVSAAFKYYLDYENKGRPIIIAGFSQGADMCFRLLKEYFRDEKLQSQLVAAYAIGCCFSEDAVSNYPELHFAQGENDTGVIVTFDCEAPELKESIFCPADYKTVSINPLNWRTDSTPAKKTMNKGACFIKSGSGEIEREYPGLCGCYIDPERGTLKVTDIKKVNYPPVIDRFAEGIYRFYDYQFFYKNLQENVGVRIDAYKAAKAQSAEPETTPAENTLPQ